jgi:hypothetical protein
MVDQQLFQEGFACLQRINPTLECSDVVDLKVARLRHGQPICEPGFSAKIPAGKTPIAGLQIADTCFCYPEDRGISESVSLGRQMAKTSAVMMTIFSTSRSIVPAAHSSDAGSSW